MAGEVRAEEKASAQRIPPTAAALVELLNSRPHAEGLAPDTLQDPASAATILRPFGQSAEAAPTPERIADVSRLREILMDIVTAPDDPAGASAWADLDEQTASITLRQGFSPSGKVQLHQVGGDPVLGGINLAVAELLADGTWSRIRICDNEHCRHAFYDTTRSRTQRWHSYEICGNRSNVAAYRSRNRKKAESAS